jgi:hypothetical protein
MKKRYFRIIEFLVVGVAMGLVEDLIAVSLATDVTINWNVVGIVLLVAIPFAFISEVIVDHPRFWELVFGGDGK